MPEYPLSPLKILSISQGPSNFHLHPNTSSYCSSCYYFSFLLITPRSTRAEISLTAGTFPSCRSHMNPHSTMRFKNRYSITHLPPTNSILSEKKRQQRRAKASDYQFQHALHLFPPQSSFPMFHLSKCCSPFESQFKSHFFMRTSLISSSPTPTKQKASLPSQKAHILHAPLI